MFIYEKNGKLNISFEKKTIPEEITPDIVMSKAGNTVTVSVGDNDISGETPSGDELVIPLLWDDDQGGFFQTTTTYTFADVKEAYNSGKTVIFENDEFGTATLESAEFVEVGDHSKWIYKTSVKGIYSESDEISDNDPFAIGLIEEDNCQHTIGYDYESYLGFNFADLVGSIDLQKNLYGEAEVQLNMYDEVPGEQFANCVISDYTVDDGHYEFQVSAKTSGYEFHSSTDSLSQVITVQCGRPE